MKSRPSSSRRALQAVAFAVLACIANASVGFAQAETPLPGLTRPPCALPNSPPEVLKRDSVDIPTKITESIGRETVRVTVLLDDAGRVTDAFASADVPALAPIGVKMGRATRFTPARHACFTTPSLVVFTANISGDGAQRSPRPEATAPSLALCTVPDHRIVVTNPIVAKAPPGIVVDATSADATVEVQIDRSGSLLGAVFVSGAKAAARAVLDAVRTGSFEPETRRCIPREGVAIVPVSFHA